MTSGATDLGYAEAARRRAEAGTTPPPGRPRWGAGRSLLILLVVLGVGLAAAAEQLRSRQPAAAKTRSALRAEVQDRTKVTDGLQAQLEKLRAQTSQLRSGLLASSRQGDSADAALADLEQGAAAVPVEGPALRVRIAGAVVATPDPLSGQGPDSPDLGQIFDRDLQSIVNALWAAGAEAIAINGQRLTALSAIRSAGQAILVDYRPLNPPYDVTAIGDPRNLAANFADSPTARQFHTLVSAVGITFQVSSVDRARLPAASGQTLYYAQPVGGTP